jgi:hypothetical protein
MATLAGKMLLTVPSGACMYASRRELQLPELQKRAVVGLNRVGALSSPLRAVLVRLAPNRVHGSRQRHGNLPLVLASQRHIWQELPANVV